MFEHSLVAVDHLHSESPERFLLKQLVLAAGKALHNHSVLVVLPGNIDVAVAIFDHYNGKRGLLIRNLVFVGLLDYIGRKVAARLQEPLQLQLALGLVHRFAADHCAFLQLRLNC